MNDLAGEVHSTSANLQLAVDEANANAVKVSNVRIQYRSSQACRLSSNVFSRGHLHMMV